MTGQDRSKFFERILEIQGRYRALGAQDRVAVLSVADAIAYGETRAKIVIGRQRPTDGRWNRRTRDYANGTGY